MRFRFAKTLPFGIILCWLGTLSSGGLQAQESTSEVTVCQGTTTPEQWVNYIRPNEEVQGITVLVNTASCNFATVPHYLATLEADEGNHWYITGSPSVYDPTTESFRVYVRFIDRPSEEPLVGNRNLMNPLNKEVAEEIRLKLRWTAICGGECLVSSDPEDDGTTAVDRPADERVNDLFTVSPNPVRNVIRVEAKIPLESLTLTSQTGELIGTYTGPTIDITQLPAGVYYLRGTDGQKSAISKVIKQ